MRRYKDITAISAKSRWLIGIRNQGGKSSRYNYEIGLHFMQAAEFKFSWPKHLVFVFQY